VICRSVDAIRRHQRRGASACHKRVSEWVQLPELRPASCHTQVTVARVQAISAMRHKSKQAADPTGVEPSPTTSSVTDCSFSSILPCRNCMINLHPFAQGVGSVGLLAGAASSTRLVARPPHERRAPSRPARLSGGKKRGRGAVRAALTGSRRAVGSRRAWVDSTP
jgi:hypothetical protein